MGATDRGCNPMRSRSTRALDRDRVGISLSLTLTLIICLTLTGLIGLSVIGAGAAAAQENESTTEDLDRENVGLDLDDQTRIEYTKHDPDTQQLTVQISNVGNRSSTVWVAQIVERGADRGEFRTIRVQPRSERTVVLDGIPDEGGDEAVMVATQRSLENQQIEWITTGESWERSVSLPQGVLIGILTMGTMTASLAYRRLTKPGKEPESAIEDKGRFKF